MRHGNLDAEKIRKLAKANDGIADRNSELGHIMHLIETCAAAQFSNRPYLSGRMLDLVFGSCDKWIRNAFRPFHCKKERKLVTTACQTSYSMLMQVPSTEGFDTLYQLVSLRLSGTKRSLLAYVTAHPVAFQYHAAERLMERTRGIDDAMETLGRSLSKWMSFAAMADAHFSAGSECFVPVGQNLGMMMGEFTDKLQGLTLCYRFDKRGLERTLFKTDGRFFVARTFVGTSQLRPEQSGAMNLLTDWAARYEAELLHKEDELLWGLSSADQDLYTVGELTPDCLSSLDNIMKSLEFGCAFTSRETAIHERKSAA